MFGIRALVLACALGVSVSGGALASTVTFKQTHQASVFGQTPAERLAKTVRVAYGNRSSARFWAGAFRVTDDQARDFKAFCIDIHETLNLPFLYTRQTQLFAPRVLSAIKGLYNTAYASVDTKVEAAAFQVALWEITNDGTGTLDLGRGGFRLLSGGRVAQTAAGYLAGLSGPATGQYQLQYYAGTGTQDLVIGTPADQATPPAPVPLPAAGLLMLAGLGGLAAVRKKRNA